MSFDAFLNQAWNDHAKQPEVVASRFNEGMQLLTTPEQIPQLAHLMTHVMGEHLQKWQKGIDLLQQLKASPLCAPNSEAAHSIRRSTVSLEIASGIEMTSDLSLSDQIRAYAMAASAVLEQSLERSEDLFKKAIALASNLDKSDPANRSLAATGHNLACALEETENKNPTQVDLMLLAAQTSRKFWEKAGTWLEVGRAEYRLAQSYLDAKNFKQSLNHAQNAIDIAKQNQAPALELFFGYEALAMAEKANQNQAGFEQAKAQVKSYFEKLSAEDQTWCEKSLQKL